MTGLLGTAVQSVRGLSLRVQTLFRRLTGARNEQPSP